MKNERMATKGTTKSGISLFVHSPDLRRAPSTAVHRYDSLGAEVALPDELGVRCLD